MTILEKIKFEEDWLSEVNLTKENIKIAFAGIRATALEQRPCEDCISREEAIRIAEQGQIQGFEWQIRKLCTLPSVTPKFTDEEIQKMQELEQAQLEKAYELGKTESFEDWLSSFNTDSATKCFTAVQELKKRLEGDIT